MTASARLTVDEFLTLLEAEGLLGPPAARDDLRKAVFANRTEIVDTDFTTLMARRWPHNGGLSVGFMAHETRFNQETDDIIEEFSDMLVGEPLKMRQTAMKGARLHVRIATPDGHGRTAVVDTSAEGLEDVVHAVNSWLLDAGANKRLYSLTTSGDWHGILACTPDRYESLRARGAFA